MVANATDYVWKSNLPCSVNPGCFFDDASNWVGDVAPSSNSDTATIEYSGVNRQIIVLREALALYQLSLSGNVWLGLVPTANLLVSDFVSLNSTILSVAGTSSINIGGTLTMTDGSGLDLGSSSSLMVQENFTIDASCTFVLRNTSSVDITASATFSNTPFINDQATLSVGLTSLTPVIFENGITSPSSGVITLGWTEIYKTASFINVAIMSDAMVTVMADAVVEVSTGSLIGSSGSTINITDNGQFIVNNAVQVIFDSLLSDTSSTIEFNVVTDMLEIGTFIANGPVLFDQVNNASLGTQVGQGMVLPLLQCSGVTSLVIQNALIQNIETNPSSTCQIEFSGPQPTAITLASTPLNDIHITVASGGELIVDSPITFTGASAIFVYGQLYVNCDILMPPLSRGILVYGPSSMIITTSVTVQATIQVEQGAISASNTTIIGELYQSQGAVLELMLKKGTNLEIIGNYNQNDNTMIKCMYDLYPRTNPLIFVQGQVVLDGSIEIDLPSTTLNVNDPYYIMSAKQGIYGSLNSTNVVFQPGTNNQYDTLVQVTDPSYFLTLTFYNKPSKS
eukprot:gene12134-14196_t